MFNFSSTRPERAMYGDKVYHRTGYYYHNFYLRQRISSINIPVKAKPGKQLSQPGKYTYLSDMHLVSMLSEAKQSSRRKRQAEAIARELWRRNNKRAARAAKLAKEFIPAAGKNPLQPDNPCKHAQIMVSLADYRQESWRYYNAYTRKHEDAYLTLTDRNNLRYLESVVSSLDIQKIVNDALNRLKFDIVPKARDIMDGVNLFTLLLELPETVALPKQIWQMLKTMPKSVTAGVAQEHLIIKWGLAPLLADGKALIDILKNFDLRLKQWFEIGSFADNDIDGRFRIRRRTAVVDLGKIINDRKVTIGAFQARNAQINYRFDAKLIVNYQIRYKPLPIQNKLQVLFDRLGLYHPWSGIWEGVPFSWLIDYFVKISEFLESFESEIQLPFEVYSAIDSYKLQINMVGDLQCERIYEVTKSGESLYKNADYKALTHGQATLYVRNIEKKYQKYFQANISRPRAFAKGSGLSFSRSANLIALAEAKRFSRAEARAKALTKTKPTTSISSSLKHLKKELDKPTRKRLIKAARRIKIKPLT